MLCFVLLASFSSLAAAELSSEQMKKAVQQLYLLAQGKEAFLIAVEPANNSISTLLYIASMKVGGASKTSEFIETFLVKRGRSDLLGVMGENEALTAISVERALEYGTGRIADSRLAVFVGEAYRDRLSEAARKAGVTLDFLDMP